MLDMGETRATGEEASNARPMESNTFQIPVAGKTISEAFLKRVDLTPNEPMLYWKQDGAYTPLTWKEFYLKSLRIFAGYRKLGLQKGDKVCIFSQTRAEWVLADYTHLATGLVTVPIYHSNTAEDVAYILENSEAKAVIVDDEPSIAKMKQAFELAKREIPILTLFEDKGTSDKITYLFSDKFSDDGYAKYEAEYRATAATVTPETTASIVYTSGTTGRPKGAVLTQRNFVAEVTGLVEIMRFAEQQHFLTFLPLAHIMSRVESMVSIFAGATMSFAENINSVAHNITEVRPTFIISVPRIFEKIYAKVQSEVQSGSEFKKNIFEWASDVGRRYVRIKSENAPVPFTLALKYKLADTLVFSKVRQKLGGRMSHSLSGGAPLQKELCEFFHACGTKIVEAYGLTETTAAVTCNRPYDYCFGTVGRPMPGMEIRMAQDGEILLRGPMIFKEYHRDPEATKEAFDVDGWFKTGDIGEINERGFLKITDRKKEIIVTSGGKNIAPQKLENLFKTSPYISSVMVYGDKRKYLTAIVGVEGSAVAKWGRSQGLTLDAHADFSKVPEVAKLIDSEIKRLNGVLASYETVKKVTVLPHDMSVEGGELTPSLKLKRKVIIKKYESLLEAMY